MVRRIIRARVRPVHIAVDPEFFKKMNLIRKDFIDRTGRDISQLGLTRVLSRSKIILPDPIDKNKQGVKSVNKKQKRRRN